MIVIVEVMIFFRVSCFLDIFEDDAPLLAGNGASVLKDEDENEKEREHSIYLWGYIFLLMLYALRTIALLLVLWLYYLSDFRFVFRALRYLSPFFFSLQTFAFALF